MATSTTGINMQKPKPQRWHDLRIGTSRTHISLTALAKGRLGGEVYISHSQADVIFNVLFEARDEIETQLGELEWQPLPEKRAAGLLETERRISKAAIASLIFSGGCYMKPKNFREGFAVRVNPIPLPDTTDAPIVTSNASTQLPSPQPDETHGSCVCKPSTRRLGHGSVDSIARWHNTSPRRGDRLSPSSRLRVGKKRSCWELPAVGPITRSLKDAHQH